MFLSKLWKLELSPIGKWAMAFVTPLAIWKWRNGGVLLKGHGNETDFLGFLQKLVPHESLTLPFEPFRFWLRIPGDSHIQKTNPRYYPYGELPTPGISDTGSRQLPASLICRVANSPHHWYAESPTPPITDTESRLLNIFKENSLYRWYGESSTPPISDTVSRRLLRETTTLRIGDPGSRYSMKKLIWFRFSELLMAKPYL